MPGESPEDVISEHHGHPAHAQTLAIACDGCRKGKLRCSRDRPRCTNCSKTGIECVYRSKRMKPGLKLGATENIHRRLDELERRLDKQEVAHHDQPSASASAESSVATEILALLGRELPKLAQKRNPQDPSPCPAGSPACKRRCVDVETVEGLANKRIEGSPSPLQGEQLQAIITAYFTHIHPWIPMLHQSRFIKRLEDEGDRPISVVLHAMELATERYTAGSRGPGEFRREWIVATAMGSLSVENLQALIILAFHDLGSSTNRAWPIVGALTRTVQFMQLAEEQNDLKSRRLSYNCLSPLNDTMDWTEEEERRRVFWCVFLLDRFCSITTGWSSGLGPDLRRRLPCDGHLWRKEESVLTPHFGLWDSRGGRQSDYLDHDSPDQPPGNRQDFRELDSTIPLSPCLPQNAPLVPSEMSNVGAFAYNIEATESLSRVFTQFLSIRPNHHSADVTLWLTRFKELDLRLVRWKLHLPHRWKANSNLTRHVPLMDPNLTTAHLTHNASMILLHQLVAYPAAEWSFHARLPSSCSAEACYSAGIEIATIIQKYLGRSLGGTPISSQCAFCLFIGARALLIHWRYMKADHLAPEFWMIVQCLDQMSSRWSAGGSDHSTNLFSAYGGTLRLLYNIHASSGTFGFNVGDYLSDINLHTHNSTAFQQVDDIPEMPNYVHGPNSIASAELEPMRNAPYLAPDEENFDLDRIIAFDDGSMFMAAWESSAHAW